MGDRMVLFPHGPIRDPRDLGNAKYAESYFEQLHACGADLQRMLDQEPNSGDGDAVVFFTQYICRNVRRTGLSDLDLQNAIVVLTEISSPMLTLLGARDKMTEEIPALKAALWMIVVNREIDPFIFDNLHGLGDVIEESSPAPYFIDGFNRHYLLLMKECQGRENLNFLKAQMRVMRESERRVARRVFTQEADTGSRRKISRQDLVPVREPRAQAAASPYVSDRYSASLDTWRPKR